MTLLAEITNGTFIGFMFLIGALAWLFGWVLGRMRDPQNDGAWQQRLEDQIRSAKTVEAKYQQQLQTVRGQLGTRENELRELIHKNSHVSAELDKSRNALEGLNDKHVMLAAELEETGSRIPPLQSRIADLEPLAGKVESLRGRVDELEPFERKIVDVEKSHSRTITQKDSELDALRRRIADLEPEIGRREARIAVLSPFESSFKKSEQQRAELARQHERTRNDLDTVRSKFEALKPEIEKRDTQIQSLTPYKARYEKSESEHRETTRRLEALTPELEQRDQHIASLTPYKARYQKSESEHRETRQELEATQRRLAAIQPEIEKRNARIEALSPFEQKYLDAEERRAALVRKYDEAIRTKDRELQRMRQRLDELSPLPARLQQRDERIRALERIERDHRGCAEEIRRLRGRTERPVQAAPVVRPVMPQLATPRSNGGRRDDLKKIWGIGKVFERELNEMGYYTFRDLAAWDSTVVERVAAKIGAFPDRIMRDRWIDQAAELAAKTVS